MRNRTTRRTELTVPGKLHLPDGQQQVHYETCCSSLIDPRDAHWGSFKNGGAGSREQ